MYETEWGTLFYKLPEQLQEAATKAANEVLKENSEKVFDKLKQTTPLEKDLKVPVGTVGDLRNALRVGEYQKTITGSHAAKNPDRVGYVVWYDGYNEPDDPNKRRPYQLVANSLNRGFYLSNGHHTVFVEPQRFISEAMHLLDGTDVKITRKWREYANKIKIGGE